MLTLDNATFAQICAFGIISDNLNKAIALYERALDKERRAFRPNMVYCWADTGLCISKRADGKTIVVGAEGAANFDRNVHTFTNGKGQKAQWMTRERALLISLNRARQSLADTYAIVTG